MAVVLGDVIRLLDAWYDPRTAEPWDAVGLVTGDPDQEVRRILFAVDPTDAVVDEAVAFGADLLVVHHPLLLTPVHGVAATTPKGRRLHRLIRSGVALFTAHTNADVPADGVNEALARAVGIVDPAPIAAASDGLDKLVTFVPLEHAEAVRHALAEAGAGRIGDYDTASFTGAGEGRFRPLAGAHPAIGEVGRLEVVPESRIEVVYPRPARARVVTALRESHPYEEPAFDLVELAAVPGVPGERGHGRVGRLAEPISLRGFAERVAAALPATAHGVRVAGERDRTIETVAVGSGAGDALLESVLGLDPDVYLTSDLRHHRAAEFLEYDGPALVDVAHWAAEWTWLPVVESKLVAALEGRGATVETRVSTLCTDPWDLHLDSVEPADHQEQR
ncbi:MAG: Nif3-like dinuclear metal center hexameric protein [Nocardioidaceae bacterium]